MPTSPPPSSPPPLRRYPAPASPPPPLASAASPSLPNAAGTLPALSLGAPRSHRRRTPARGPGGDEAVRSTDSDALLSRLSAVSAGYLPSDPYAAALVSPTTHGQAAWRVVPGGGAVPVASSVAWRRPPVINLGTYLRCAAVDEVVNAFIMRRPLPGLERPLVLSSPSSSPPPTNSSNPASAPGAGVQMISLGAGSDSRFWRLKADPILGPRVARYIELDFAQITQSKVERILHSEVLSAPLRGSGGFHVSATGTDLDADEQGYHLVACDVRELVGQLSAPDAGSQSQVLRAALEKRVDPALPTIVVAECFLLYLAPDVAQAALRYVLSDLLHPAPQVAIISYDVVLSGQTEAGSSPPRRTYMSDFGQVMLHNLSTRGLDIPSAKANTLPGDHTQRLDQALQAPPPSQVQTNTTALSTIWGQVAAEDKARLSQVEGLDELEELDLLLHHYTISVGSRKLA